MTKVVRFERDILVFGLLMLAGAWMCAHAFAGDAGRIKVSKGDVQIERNGKLMPAPVGAVIEAEDTVRTGADSSVGITFHDNSLLSAGPNSKLLIKPFVFDTTTPQAKFN